MLKTTSPTDIPSAPMELPRNWVPSANIKIAGDLNRESSVSTDSAGAERLKRNVREIGSISPSEALTFYLKSEHFPH